LERLRDWHRGLLKPAGASADGGGSQAAEPFTNSESRLLCSSRSPIGGGCPWKQPPPFFAALGFELFPKRATGGRGLISPAAHNPSHFLEHHNASESTFDSLDWYWRSGGQFVQRTAGPQDAHGVARSAHSNLYRNAFDVWINPQTYRLQLKRRRKSNVNPEVQHLAGSFVIENTSKMMIASEDGNVLNKAARQ
jgi:hypothetical protein